MAIKKSQLYNTLWEACNALRGGMDASQYKDYVLVILFLKYISDKAKSDPESLITIPEGCSFYDIIELAGQTSICEKMNTSLEAIAKENHLEGVINTVDFADENKLGKGKDMIDTVSKLCKVFQNENLNFANNRAADDDLIGDAYEYLMRQFASQSGKSKGQFYTPAEVSRVMANIVGINKDKRTGNISIYDPACGSGSLLLRAKAEAPHNNVSLDGQEKDLATIGMARMSMIIHGVEDANLMHEDTLNKPLNTLQNDNILRQYDYIVANPPFSLKGWMKTAQPQDKYGRWGIEEGQAPVPPNNIGDLAFLLHIVASLKSDGKAACILPHGVLFRSNDEARIREWLVRHHLISGIIGLPPNLFYGTGIPACIIIIDKQNAINAEGIFMIDAKEGYTKDGNKNRLREMDIRFIEDTWKAKQDIPHFARFVKYEEITEPKNAYNLNLPRYIAPKDTEVQQDITAHLHGGIPAHDVEQVLAHYWDACPSLKEQLYQKQENGYYHLLQENTLLIRETINSNTDYLQHSEHYRTAINDFFNTVVPEMKQLQKGFKPKDKIEQWSTLLLEKAGAQRLVNPYEVYDILRNYWAETMQDDCYLIAHDDWTITTSTQKRKPTYRDILCDLVPVDILVKEYFAHEEKNILDTEDDIEQKMQEKNDFEEENADIIENENGIIILADIKKRIKTEDDKDIKTKLQQYVDLNEDIKTRKDNLKKLMEQMWELVMQKYETITKDEIKHLVVECKWQNTITNRCYDLLTEVSQKMTTDIIALRDRYIQTLPQIETQVQELRAKVNANLAAMGIQLNKLEEQHTCGEKTPYPPQTCGN